MSNPVRVTLVVLGALLLVFVFGPLLFMGGMMGGMMGAMMGGGAMSWSVGGLAVVVLLASVGLIAAGLWRR